MKYNWQKMSETFSDDGEIHDVLIVGSGYGGGVAASRLARVTEDLKVTVLERGREIAPGEYPDDMFESKQEFQLTLSQSGERIGKRDALYDFRVGDDVNVLLGCGLGGTSLINANVAIEVDPRIFKSWPKEFHDDSDPLRAYYDRARKMLGSTPYPTGRTLPKLEALERAADGMGERFFRPDINVSFRDEFNNAGILQAACTDCGDCVSGCNYGAKNTVLMNYLPDAAKNGARLMTGAEVRTIRQADGLWQVAVYDIAREKTVEVTARMVILAAGTLGSTEILLRSRSKDLTFSDRLGHGFSGNGDIWAFGYNANMEVDGERAPVYGVGAGTHKVSYGPEGEGTPFKPGPCITGLIDMREGREVEDGLIIEEGVMPGALGLAYSVAFPMLDALMGDPTRFGDTPERIADLYGLGETLKKKPLEFAETVYSGPVSRTLPFLVMSHDASDGVLEMRSDKITVNWPDAGKDPSIIRNNETIRQASDAIQAEFLPNPLWRDALHNRVVVVHPLGGCQMGNDAKDGVINHACQVFDGAGAFHDGLFVCDGAAIPGSVGVNPHLTITAVAERAMHLLIQERGWDVDETTNDTEAMMLHSAPPEQSEVVLKQAIDGLSQIADAIDNKMWELARMMLAGVWRQLTEALEGIEAPDEKLPVPIPDVEAFLAVLGDPHSLSTIVRPILQQLLEILQPAREAYREGRLQELSEFIEGQLGDFSPRAGFAERMEGQISTVGLGDTPPPTEPYRVAAEAGTRCVFEADINTPHVSGATTPPDGFSDINSGTLSTDLLGDFDVSEGKFRYLIPEPDQIEDWRMIYTATLTPSGKKTGKALEFRGHKILRRRHGSNWWRDVTELNVDILEDGKTIARGQLTLGLENLLRQADGLSIEYKDRDLLCAAWDAYSAIAELFPEGRKDNRKDELPKLFESRDFRANVTQAVIYALDEKYPLVGVRRKLGTYFAGKVFARMGTLVLRTYGGIFAYMSDFPAQEAREKLPLAKGLPKPEVYYPEPEPDVYLKLTRYKGGSKGPVMLAGGFGTNASSFATPTVDKTIVHTLTEAGYDVWLFDYRGSGDIEASQQPFNLDDVARKDWPAAIDVVTEVTRVDDVQVVVHCIGSMSLFMAVLAGEKRIRSIIASQLAVHAISNWFNYAKADAEIVNMIEHGLPPRLRGILDLIGLPEDVAEIIKTGMPVIDPRSPAERSPGANLDNVIDGALWNVPSFAPVTCYSPTCHRINAIFGPSYRHAQLNEATHNNIRHMFGPISIHPGQHIAKIYETGYVISEDGSFDYLKEHANLSMPVHFIVGARNQEMLPEATLRTLDWLRRKNPQHKNTYSRHVFQDYGHMDCFIGKDAAKDIFPHILNWLDNPLRDPDTQE